ncbi:hypothetical protein [Amycolatopsis sp. NPDC059021]|uniref:hypothetical protein n=1 Tax=Amycolatopsis sp. NPDC059021 TaxID=3346704 RepID=UPI00366A5772
MSLFLKRSAMVVAGLAIMLGTGSSAFASTTDMPAGGGSAPSSGCPVLEPPKGPIQIGDPGPGAVPATPIPAGCLIPAPVGTPGPGDIPVPGRPTPAPVSQGK